MIKKFLIKVIRIYQQKISITKPARCRFYPTCSEYSAVAISRFGVTRGILLSIWRLLRCNPFFRGGFDPVPERKKREGKIIKNQGGGLNK